MENLYTIYRIIESQGRGDPSDESESWDVKVSYQLIKSGEKMREFGEWCADKSGDQDYSSRFQCEKVIGMDCLEELQKIAKTIIDFKDEDNDDILQKEPETCQGCGDEFILNENNLCTICQELKDDGAFEFPPIVNVVKEESK